MATTRSRNKWLVIVIALVIIIGVLWLYSNRNAQKKHDQLAYNCKNKVWYSVPQLQFKGFAPETKTAVTIKRKGEQITNKLQLKQAKANNDSLAFELVAIEADSTVINKSDTILITIGNEKHTIYGFNSNSYYGDHHILFCDELYQMDGKPFRTTELNWIYKKK
ncbi:hypothetical protein D0C36_23760 [Mucilaginibacter conchicola]|uniref:Uncharacterized protein n=1 Tax=Mucilaginibacter conchicola TaxID=2303333 RepID=A0A372NN04_9SPHI|nr:hypothetical protein [Mucilaginibacter conchicola]RFZ89977.1 hypothetical protein D0C36_23760 [Mucilaginibacter conchicola]